MRSLLQFFPLSPDSSSFFFTVSISGLTAALDSQPVIDQALEDGLDQSVFSLPGAGNATVVGVEPSQVSNVVGREVERERKLVIEETECLSILFLLSPSIAAEID